MWSNVLRDLSSKGIGLFKLEVVEDSLDTGETSTDITDNEDDKHKCSETDKGNYRSDLS